MTTDEQRSELYKALIGKKRLDYYLKRFTSFDERGGGFYPSWNWAAFFLTAVWAPFTSAWALYRKMYAVFFTLWGIAFILLMILAIVGSALSLNFPIVYLTCYVALMIGFGLYGNALYYRHTKKKIAKAQTTRPDAETLLSYIQSKGGVHVWVIWVFLIVPFVGGILAAIAVPAYQDYTIRSRTHEAASLAAAPKTAVDVAYTQGMKLGSLPDHAGLGLSSPASYRSKYVASVTVARSGMVTILLTADPELGPIAGETIAYIPQVQNGRLIWTVNCSFAAKWCPRSLR